MLRITKYQKLTVKSLLLYLRILINIFAKLGVNVPTRCVLILLLNLLWDLLAATFLTRLYSTDDLLHFLNLKVGQTCALLHPRSSRGGYLRRRMSDSPTIRPLKIDFGDRKSPTSGPLCPTSGPLLSDFRSSLSDFRSSLSDHLLTP